jgi:putrescine transport system permease protein
MQLRKLPAVNLLGALLARIGLRGRTAVIAIPYIWLLLFFLIPFVIVLKISFSESQISMPPYQPLVQWVGNQWSDIRLHLNPGNFLYLWEDSLYLHAVINSLKVAAISTLLALLIGIQLPILSHVPNLPCVQYC